MCSTVNTCVWRCICRCILYDMQCIHRRVLPYCNRLLIDIIITQVFFRYFDRSFLCLSYLFSVCPH